MIEWTTFPRHRRAQQVDVTTAPRDYRKELWIEIATAVARAENCTRMNGPSDWADAVLARFDKTFPEAT